MRFVVNTMVEAQQIGAAEEVSNPQNKVGVITASTATTPLALSLAVQ
jgi:hypothetical protein